MAQGYVMGQNGLVKMTTQNTRYWSGSAWVVPADVKTMVNGTLQSIMPVVPPGGWNSWEAVMSHPSYHGGTPGAILFQNWAYGAKAWVRPSLTDYNRMRAEFDANRHRFAGGLLRVWRPYQNDGSRGKYGEIKAYVASGISEKADEYGKPITGQAYASESWVSIGDMANNGEPHMADIPLSLTFMDHFFYGSGYVTRTIGFEPNSAHNAGTVYSLIRLGDKSPRLYLYYNW